jgi:hypothetical protein
MPVRASFSAFIVIMVVAVATARIHASSPWMPPASAEARKPLGSARTLPAPAGPGRGSEVTAADGTQRDTSASGNRWLSSVGVLAAVVVLIIGAALGLRAFARRGAGGLLGALGPGGHAPSGVLEVLGRYPVGRGATLVLLKMDRRILLLCQNNSRAGGGAMTTLAEVRDPEEVASILLKTRDEEGNSLARRFESLLAGEQRTFDEPQRQPLAGAVRAGDAARRVRGRLAALRGRTGTEVRA